MRFSGHETFAIREGWLYKGLLALAETPDFFEQPFPADRLGVGSNMAKSIRHWLVATGLAEYRDNVSKSRSKRITVSGFGQIVLEYDPYFNRLGTWCFIHVNLVNLGDATAAWEWFYGSCADSVFDRSDVLEQFRRWAQHNAPRQPSPTTMQKDLNCLFASYAQRVSSEKIDPEEAMDCPLWDLGLITFYRGSMSFRVNRSSKKIPLAAIGYSLSMAGIEDEPKGGKLRISFEEAAAIKGGPGRSFLMGPSGLYETISTADEANSCADIEIDSIAGQRVIKYSDISPSGWVRHYYEGMGI